MYKTNIDPQQKPSITLDSGPSITVERAAATAEEQQPPPPHHTLSTVASTKICSASKCSLNESRLPLQCRICHSAGDLISLPCHCKGTISSAHVHCLERWLNQSSTICCDLCGYQFNVETKLKYGCWESLRIWATNSTTKILFRYDSLIFICVSMAIAVLTIQLAFRIDELYTGWQKIRTRSYYDDLVFTIYVHLIVYIVFGVLLLFGYMANVTFFCHTQMVPWFRWWRNSRRIKIIWPNTKGQITDVSIFFLAFRFCVCFPLPNFFRLLFFWLLLCSINLEDQTDLHFIHIKPKLLFYSLDECEFITGYLTRSLCLTVRVCMSGLRVNVAMLR